MGYWVDLDDPYITYDNRYIETLWWLLKQLYNKDLLYKGYTIKPYSPAAGTGLSSHELNQPGCYRDVKDTTVVAQFRMKNPKAEMMEWGTPYFLAWTTTPWTLPSNTALCVGPKIDYVAVQTYNPYTAQPITVLRDGSKLMGLTLTVNYQTTYQGFLDMVSYLSTDSRVTSVQYASIQYDAASDTAVGNITLLLYLMDSNDLEYLPPEVFEPDTGKDNIFE